MELRISAAVIEIEDVEPTAAQARKANTKEEHLAMVRHVRHFGPATVRLYDDNGNLVAEGETDFHDTLDMYFPDAVDHRKRRRAAAEDAGDDEEK